MHYTQFQNKRIRSRTIFTVQLINACKYNPNHVGPYLFGVCHKERRWLYMQRTKAHGQP
ncbi:hypothetical protein Hanom_Chr12g01071351 [Helianthus anomalus]